MFKSLKINRSIRKIVIIIVLAVLILPNFVMAKSPALTKDCEIPHGTSTYNIIKINFNLPGVTEKVVIKDKTYYQVRNLKCFIIGIYVYFSGVAGILATVMIMYGGVKYVISMGNSSRMGDAKDTIFSASVGLVLVLGAYVLLNLINPNITTLKVPGLDLALVPEIGKECTSNAVPDTTGKIFCGDKGIETLIQDIPITPEIEKIQTECYYTKCQKDADFCTYVDEKQVYECLDAKSFCEIKKGADNCEKNDKKIIKAGITDKGCFLSRSAYTGNEEVPCKLYDLLSCSNGWAQVKCDIDTTSNTPCWNTDTNKPTSLGSFKCTNGRTSLQYGTICCADFLVNVDCRNKNNCNSDEFEDKDCQIEVNSTLYNLKHPADGGNGGTSSCRNIDLTNNKVCCVQLELKQY